MFGFGYENFRRWMFGVFRPSMRDASTQTDFATVLYRHEYVVPSGKEDGNGQAEDSKPIDHYKTFYGVDTNFEKSISPHYIDLPEDYKDILAEKNGGFGLAKLKDEVLRFGQWSKDEQINFLATFHREDTARQLARGQRKDTEVVTMHDQCVRDPRFNRQYRLYRYHFADNETQAMNSLAVSMVRDILASPIMTGQAPLPNQRFLQWAAYKETMITTIIVLGELSSSTTTGPEFIDPFWPIEENGCVEYASNEGEGIKRSITITNKAKQVNLLGADGYVLTMTTSEESKEASEMPVCLFHVSKWPIDGDAVNTEFSDLIKHLYESPRRQKLAVHCANGVTFSPTFLTIWFHLQALASGINLINPFGVISHIRNFIPDAFNATKFEPMQLVGQYCVVTKLLSLLLEEQDKTSKSLSVQMGSENLGGERRPNEKQS